MEKKKKIYICSVISLILAIIIETLFIGNNQINANLVSRVLILTGIINFLSLHFVLGIRKIYNFIVEHRYKISGIMIIISTILGFFSSSVNLQEWLTNTEKVLTLWWNIKFYTLLLASYELFSIITNKNQNLSIAGTIVLAFSGCIQWNFTKIDSLILGEIIIVLLDKIFSKEYLKEKILISFGIIISSIGYIYAFRPYAICFGYVFLSLIIWIILKNKDNLKINNNLTIVILTFICSIVGGILFNVFLPKVYTEDLNLKINGLSGLFSYIYNCLLPFYEFQDKELLGSIISLFPVPMLISLYYMYKNEKHIEFLFPTTIVAVLGTVFCFSNFPEIIGKITMLSEINTLRMMPAVQIANLFIMFYFMANIKEKIFSVKSAMRITIVIVALLAIIGLPDVFRTRGFLLLFACELSALIFLFLNLNDEKYQKVFLFFLLLTVLIGGVTVNPIV